VFPGKSGTAPERGPNRAVESLIVKGKCGPLQPRRRVSLGSVITESIIGVDNRTRVLETDLTPWRMICALRIVAPLGTFLGTGFLAGPATVITAGHCVYDRVQMGGWATRIEVTPGLNGSQQSFPMMSATTFSTVTDWVDSRDADLDYGAIHLPEAAGATNGYFTTASVTDSDLQDTRVNICGYPGDRGNGVEQWFHQNRVLVATPRRVFYDVDTAGGQSGSPVWMYPDGGSEPVVIGIHAYGIGATPASLNITANSSPRITDDVLEQIVQWSLDDASRFAVTTPPEPTPCVIPQPPTCQPLSV
jgi:V8-like Glu-specific endopeptidase